MSPWEKSGQFDQAWKLHSQSNDPTFPLETPIPVVELSSESSFRRPPEVLIQWRMVDGLLAIHQGGGIMGLVHPFWQSQQGAESGAISWSENEANLVVSPEGPYRADLFRSYLPIPSCDRRYLFFSTPYALLVLDLWTLPGWTVGQNQPQADLKKLLDLTDQPEMRIAAAPIPLAWNPNRMGVLLYDSRHETYYWHIVSEEDHTKRDLLDNLNDFHKLSMKGFPCQCGVVSNRAIAFSTSREHWVWNRNDALEANPDGMKRTLALDDACLLLDQHVDNRNAFSWPRQHLLPVDGEGNHLNEATGFNWYYQRVDRAGALTGRFETYSVRLDDLNAQLPGVFDTNQGALPIGSWLSDNGTPEMLCLASGLGGEVHRHTFGTRLEPTRILTVDRNDIQGLCFRDPLLLILSRDTQSLRSITLRSLRHHAKTARVCGLRLTADPLIWSHWLFTCEREGDVVRICQRKIPLVETP